MMKRLFFIAFLGLSLSLLYTLPASAVHKGAGDLTCGNCHTMHNSQGNAEMEGASGGSVVLLRGSVASREEIHNLCLQCHADNGSQATVAFNSTYTAPKVYINGQGGAGNSTTSGTLESIFKIGAGGDFSAELSWNGTGNATDTTSEGKGHSLGITNAKPPGNTAVPGIALTTTNGAFSCTNCHDPHGAASNTSTVNVFRNLKVYPSGAGNTTGAVVNAANTGYKSGIASAFDGSNSSSGATLIWAVAEDSISGTPSSDTTKTNHYAYSGATSTDSLSYWCARCHDRWHEDIATTNETGQDWKRHPVDNLLVDSTPTSGGGATIVDLSTYTTSVITGGSAVPVAEVSTQTNPVYYRATDASRDSTDKVFCLSCHFAHGGPYYDNLRFDYLASVGSGTDYGKGLASNVGCQQCHNR